MRPRARRRTASGSAAHAIASGQRAKNRSACWRYCASTTRPVCATWARYASINARGVTGADGGGSVLASASGIVGSAHVRGSEMDIGQRGVDMVMAQQRLHDGQVDAGLGQRGAKGVTQRVRVARRHPAAGAVITKHRAQPAAVKG